MTETEFNDAVDATLLEIEEVIDASGADIDYETVAGILTLSFADGSQIIINRQGPARQIWVAARSGGFHFDWNDGQWCRDSDGEPLYSLLSRACSEQAGETVALQ